MMKFEAAVLRAPGESLRIETIHSIAPGPGQVLIRTAAASLCHTDLEVIEGQLEYPMPIVLGHEAAGVIEQVGPDVDPARRGEHAAVSWNPHCGQCFYCNRGQPILCCRYRSLGPRAVAFDGTTKLSLADGPLHTMFYTAAFAEYMLVSAPCAVAIPRDMPLDRACLLGCGVLTGVGAATRVGQVTFGETVVIIGCGAVGLSSVQGARLAGASQIVAVDRSDAKLDLAGRLGATHTVNVAHDDLTSITQSLTMGRGADCVIESAGNEAAFQSSLEACRPGGRVVWLGKVGIRQEVSFRWGTLMEERQITRCSYGGAQTTTDFPALSQAYLMGRLHLDELITSRIPLEEINSGFDALRTGRAVRSVITFDDSTRTHHA